MQFRVGVVSDSRGGSMATEKAPKVEKQEHSYTADQLNWDQVALYADKY